MIQHDETNQKKQNQTTNRPIHFIFRDYDDSPITEVWVSEDRSTVRCKNYKYDKEPCLQAFNGNPNPTWQSVLDFFEERCFSRYRGDVDELLSDLHMKEYDPEAIVRRFKGRANQDSCWIEFIEDAE